MIRTLIRDLGQMALVAVPLLALLLAIEWAANRARLALSSAPVPVSESALSLAAENTKLRLAHSSCDQRAKEMERRWLEARSK